MREVRLTYRLTEADLLEGRQHAKISGNSEDVLRSLMLLVALITLLYATPAIWNIFEPPATPSSLPKQLILGVAPWVYVIGFFNLLTKTNRKEQARLYWKISPLYQSELTACLDDEGLSIESPYSRSKDRWQVIIGFCESPNLLLLVMSGGGFNMLPKRALPADTNLDELRQEIGKRINGLCQSPDEITKHPEPTEPTLIPRMHFKLNKTEFSRARNADPRTKWLRLIQEGLIIVPILAGFFWLDRSAGLLHIYSPLWVWFGVFVVLLIAHTIVLHLHWREAPYLHGQQVVDVMESGIVFHSVHGARWIGWGAIERYVRKDKVFAICLRDKTFRCIPERAFLTKEDENTFEMHLQSRVMRTPGFAVVMNSKMS